MEWSLYTCSSAETHGSLPSSQHHFNTLFTFLLLLSFSKCQAVRHKNSCLSSWHSVLVSVPRALLKQAVILCFVCAGQPCLSSLPTSATVKQQRGQQPPHNTEGGKKRKEKNAELCKGLQATYRSKHFRCLHCRGQQREF